MIERSDTHDLVTRGHLTRDEQAAFVSTIRTAALRGQFAMSLTMFAVIAAATTGPSG